MALFGGRGKRAGAGMSASVAGAGGGRQMLEAIRMDEESSAAADVRVTSDVRKMIDQGVGSIVDLWAPPRMKILSDYIEMGDEALAICTVATWPTDLTYGWLDQLLNDPALADVKIDMSMHIHPIRKEYALSYMEDKRVSAISSMEAERAHGKRRDSDLEVFAKQAETAAGLYEMLRGNPNENLFQVSVTFGIYGEAHMQTGSDGRVTPVSAKDDVIIKMDRFKRRLKEVSGGGFAVKPLLHQQRDGIKTLLPWGYGGLHSFQNMYTSALATCYPFTRGTLQVEGGVLYGQSLTTQQPVFFDAFNRDWLESYSCVVMGATGSGKSATVKTLLGRYAVRGTQVFVIDPSIGAHSEYEGLANSLDGTVVQFGGVGGMHMNPFELTPPMEWTPMLADPAEETVRRRRVAKGIVDQKVAFLLGLFELMERRYDVGNGGVSHKLDRKGSVTEALIRRLYAWWGVRVGEDADFGENLDAWDPARMPTMADFSHLLRVYEAFISSYDTQDKIAGWKASVLGRDGTLRNKQSREDIIRLGYVQMVRAAGGELWGTRELAVIRYLRDVVAEYTSGGDGGGGILRSLFSGRHEGRPDAARLNAHCVVFRVGNLGNNDELRIQDMVTYMTFEMIYQRITSANADRQRSGEGGVSRYVVAMDEVWKHLDTEATRRYVIKLIREGRKLNAGVWAISQRYGDFVPEGGEGRDQTIYSQSTMRIVMALDHDDAVRYARDNGLSASLERVIDKGADGDKHPGTGILQVNGKRKAAVGIYVGMSPMEMAIADTTNANARPFDARDMAAYVNV